MGAFDWTTAEDSSFVAGDSPAVITLAAPYVEGYIACDGAGDITVEVAPESTSYGNSVTLKQGEVITIGGTRIANIRITHTGTNSAYRVVIVPVNPVGR